MKNLLLLLMVAWAGFILAQANQPTVFATAGTIYQGDALSLDWTLGEVAITTIEGQPGQVTQGFHQPTYVITHLNEIAVNWGEIKIFPNPATDQIQLDFSKASIDPGHFQLWQTDGQLLWKVDRNKEDEHFRWSMKELAAGTYFLRIHAKNAPHFITIKIQKI